MKDISFIYQPHFKTEKFRVACKEQQGKLNNYVVVTCSPLYNGVYQYPADNLSKYQLWWNNKTPCYCVPIKDCTLIKRLQDLKNPEIVNKIRAQQKHWLNNEVKNRNYVYKKIPDWML